MYFAKCLCVAYYKPAKEQGDHSELKFIIFCIYNYNYVITVQLTMSQQKSKVTKNYHFIHSIFFNYAICPVQPIISQQKSKVIIDLNLIISVFI